MTTTQWIITLIGSLLGGGAMGALINTLVTRYRNRQQPISYSLETFEMFNKDEYKGLQAELTILDHANSNVSVVFENLSVARLVLVNKGNHDIELFDFGVTLSGDSAIVDIKLESPDRHHTANCLELPDVRETTQELDFTLKPFNREDQYTFNIYLTHYVNPGKITLSSAHSTRFVKKESTTNKLSTTLAIIVSIGVGLSGLGLGAGLATGNAFSGFWAIGLVIIAAISITGLMVLSKITH